MNIKTRVALLSVAAVLAVGLFANLTLPVRTVALTIFGTPVGLAEGSFGLLWDALRVGGFFSREDGKVLAERMNQESTAALVQKEESIVQSGEAREQQASGGGVVVPVLRRSFTALEQSLLVQAPANVQEGMVAYSDGAYIGRVASVQGGRAVIELAWSLGTDTNAMLAGSGVAVVMVGQGAGFWTVRVPRSQKVEVGEVLVSNHGNRDVMGSVRAVAPESASPFTEFVVRSSINPSLIQFVTLRPYAQ